jgi:SAM-dependent methyltransferase
VISEIHDGATRELLLRSGFMRGCRFVEFGCGLGYVSRWAASQGARATGLDVNEEQIKACRILAETDGVDAEFRSANIYEPSLEPDSIDVAYCRWLMVHLNRPVEAMHTILKALKPGGVMVCEEADISGVYAVPHSAAYEEMRDSSIQAGHARNVDYEGGRCAHLWAKQAGFELIHVAAYHPHYLNGPHKGFWNWTLRIATQNLVSEGTMSRKRWEELVEGMTEADNSPETVVAHSRMHQLIARKPKAVGIL